MQFLHAAESSMGSIQSAYSEPVDIVPEGCKCNHDIACVCLRVLINRTRMPRHLAGDFLGQFETERPSANPHLMRVMLTNNYDVPQRFANGISTRSGGKSVPTSV